MRTKTTPNPGASGTGTAGTADAVLASARSNREVADAAEVRLLQDACAWADLHPPEGIHPAATVTTALFGDTGLPLAGEGAPAVAEFCVAEFAASVGLGTESGKALIGEALELRHRLPNLWTRVMSGELAAWKARRVAAATIVLSPAAVEFVDVAVTPVAHKVTPGQVDRLVAEAIGRCDPQLAQERADRAVAGRHVTITHGQVSFDGTSQVHGILDLADALDLDTAVANGAAQLKALGSTEDLDARRATALGSLARRQLALDLNPNTPDTGDLEADRGVDETDEAGGEQVADAAAGAHEPAGRAGSGRVKPRQAVLYLHLAAEAITGTGHRTEKTGQPGRSGVVGRCELSRSPVTADQIRTWLAHPDAQVVVKPVLDHQGLVPVDAYEVPDRMGEAIRLRDGTCVFPWCTRPARSCDADHVVPYDPDGPPGQTATGNLGALCRRHHRLKTHGAWSCHTPRPGVFEWTSPHGLRFRRDRTGTLDITDPACPAGSPPEH
ncbi:HNH endonuclease signature motif containing protein [Nocardioides donggukensis]|uniref:HNH endonuclease n=1 Tax=Nocardioides donggukensis TaxID=2774019 RepID=A0A927Q2K2_9ACTN|nr:HNH endonuclease signature motif containing protein [Nocardioides donggukensis]MBD8869746.1 HNH endonuclease [Nocardioides donggukensis]